MNVETFNINPLLSRAWDLIPLVFDLIDQDPILNDLETREMIRRTLIPLPDYILNAEKAGTEGARSSLELLMAKGAVDHLYLIIALSRKEGLIESGPSSVVEGACQTLSRMLGSQIEEQAAAYRRVQDSVEAPAIHQT